MGACQRLFLDVINARRDEQEAAWTWVEPSLNEWAAPRRAPRPSAAGSWEGPQRRARCSRGTAPAGWKKKPWPVSETGLNAGLAEPNESIELGL